MSDERKITEAMDAERTEIARAIWLAHGDERTPGIFDRLNQPPSVGAGMPYTHPMLRDAFKAADDLLRSVAVVKALFDVRLSARLRGDKRTTGARMGISDYSTPDLVVALHSWGDEMDRSASELLSAGQINAGGGTATVAALMKEAAARLQNHAG